MARGVGSGGSGQRVVGSGEIARSRHTLRFADGGTLELGRRTEVMAICNVTPDSFSDAGRHLDSAAAVAAAAGWIEAGARIVDVGGESTRPGAAEIDADQETRRVVPVIEAIKRELDTRVSVDTRKAAVARAALDAGADMINDVSALADPAMAPLVAKRQVPVVLMHMRGQPCSMQRDTHYDDVCATLCDFLRERVDFAASAGLANDKILLDPGIGFGKSVEGNLTILRQIAALAALGRPVLIGASRKSFVGALTRRPVDDRLEESLAIAGFASAAGAHIIRAHDVAETVRVVRMVDAIRGAA